MTSQAGMVRAEEAEKNECDNGHNEYDFAFAFNNKAFSNKVLTIEVMADPIESHSLTTVDYRAANCKRLKKHSANCKGDNFSNANNTSMGMSSSKVRTIHVNSAILAAKSPFFSKMFSNGMRESEQQNVTLRIDSFEEAAVLDLLKFMYTNTLSRSTSVAAVFGVLMAADKFEVASCIKYCGRMLMKMPMTCEIALLCLDLPSSTLMSSATQPLIEAGKLFLAKHYRDLTKFEDEVLNLPLAGIEAVLSSDDLLIYSEDDVYKCVLKWAEKHYPKIEDRRGVLGSRLGLLIRFSYMTNYTLKEVLKAKDFHPDDSKKFVFEALLFKSEPQHQQRLLAQANHNLVERAYQNRLVKVVEFALPRPRSIVYLNLKKEECANLFPRGQLFSEAFPFAGHGFYLIVGCYSDDQNPSSHYLGFFLGKQNMGLVSIDVEFEFSVKSTSEDYISMFSASYTFTGGNLLGHEQLVPWNEFMADDSELFKDGLLQINVELCLEE